MRERESIWLWSPFVFFPGSFPLSLLFLDLFASAPMSSSWRVKMRIIIPMSLHHNMNEKICEWHNTCSSKYSCLKITCGQGTCPCHCSLPWDQGLHHHFRKSKVNKMSTHLTCSRKHSSYLGNDSPCQECESNLVSCYCHNVLGTLLAPFIEYSLNFYENIRFDRHTLHWYLQLVESF